MTAGGLDQAADFGCRFDDGMTADAERRPNEFVGQSVMLSCHPLLILLKITFLKQIPGNFPDLDIVRPVQFAHTPGAIDHERLILRDVFCQSDTVCRYHVKCIVSER